jgi:hypothetical protein
MHIQFSTVTLFITEHGVRKSKNSTLSRPSESNASSSASISSASKELLQAVYPNFTHKIGIA